MAEWLTQAGSILGTGNFFFLFFYDDDGGATRSGAGKRERQPAGMSAANVGASYYRSCTNVHYMIMESFHKMRIQQCYTIIIL